MPKNLPALANLYTGTPLIVSKPRGLRNKPKKNQREKGIVDGSHVAGNDAKNTGDCTLEAVFASRLYN